MVLRDALQKIRAHSKASTKARDRAIDKLDERFFAKETKFEKSIVKQYARANKCSVQQAIGEIEENL